MDFAEFTLGLVKSEVECRNSVSWRGGMKGSADRFLWESVRYELETSSRMRFTLNAGTSGNR